MAYTKITEADLVGKGVIGLPDTPSLSTTEMQQKFDEIATDVIVPKFNNLVEELDASNIDKRIESETITNMRLNEDNNIEVSIDGGTTYKQTASSGHIIMDGTGRSFPQRSRIQYSANVIISDNPIDNTTFMQVPSGVKGDKGDSATITVGNVETTPTPYVNNVGSQFDAIFDFGIPKGQDGQSATIQVGTVTSGTNASVSNRGTSSSAIFDFVLPKGEKGDSGTSFQVLGTYPTYADLIAAHPTGNRGDAYAIGDSVSNEVYNWNNDTKTWDNLGGLKGVKGDNGKAATITIGTVTEGTTPNVENVGTSENAILNFTLQKGEKGDVGNAATIAVGKVERGEVATVTNVGTTTNAVFDFTIPKGDKGDTGAPSVVNGKSGEAIVLYGYDMYLKNYNKANQYTDITDDDSVQSAISKLEARNSGGSKITVYTDEESIGHTFTVSNGAKTLTQIADSSLKMEFFVDDIGKWTVTNVEADRSAEIDIVYFSAFSVSLGMGDVSIEVEYSADYIGYDFSITNGSKTKTKTADDSLKVAFVVADYGTWTVSNTLNDTKKVVNAPEGGKYTVTFGVAPAYGYQAWLDTANITKTFNSLAEVLADEPTVRILMNKHASVDYLVGWYENDESLKATLLASDNALKWIGLRDYAYDTIGNAIEGFISEWIASDKWEFALKDSVPIMTSNNAPYGETFADGAYNSQFWHAFDNNPNTYWYYNETNNIKLGYKFVNPICVKRIEFELHQREASTNAKTDSYYVVGYNGSTWERLTESQTIDNTSGTKNITCELPNNDKYYMHYALVFYNSISGSGLARVYKCQFYGRALTVSVPIMTSNIAPWGEVIASYEMEPYLKWKAFNGILNIANDSWATWRGQVKDDLFIGYDFVNPVIVKSMFIENRCEGSPRAIAKYKIQGSNDNSVWEDITNDISNPNGQSVRTYKNIDNDKEYRYYRLLVLDYHDSDYCGLQELQFYGKDYSEHEERHYIYDNGVEVEEISTYSNGSGNIAEKRDGELYVEYALNGQGNYAEVITSNKVDLTSYNLLRFYSPYGRIDSISAYCSLWIGNKKPMGGDGSSISSVNATYGSNPRTLGLDISSLNDEYYISSTSRGSADSAKGQIRVIKEIWLE